MNKVKYLSIVASSVLLFSACGGGSGGTSSNGKTISGKVVDDPIVGATVCYDSNKNDSCADESVTTTSGNQGEYTLTLPAGKTEANILAESVDGQTTMGGKKFDGKFSTKLVFAEGSEVNINPATTMATKMVDNSDENAPVTPEEAKKMAEEASGLGNINDVSKEAQKNLAALNTYAKESNSSTTEDPYTVLAKKMNKEKKEGKNPAKDIQKEVKKEVVKNLDADAKSGVVYPANTGKVYYDGNMDGKLSDGEASTAEKFGYFDVKAFKDVEGIQQGNHKMYIFKAQNSDLSYTSIDKNTFKDHMYITPVSSLITELGNLLGAKIGKGETPVIGNIAMGDLTDLTKIAKALSTYKTKVSAADLMANPTENENLKRVCDRIALALKTSGKSYTDLAKEFENMTGKYDDLEKLLKPFVPKDKIVFAEEKVYDISTKDFNKLASTQESQAPRLMLSYDPTYPERVGTIKDQFIYAIKVAGSDFVSKYAGKKAFLDKLVVELEGAPENYVLTTQNMGAGKTSYYIESKTMETKAEDVIVNIKVNGEKKYSFTLSIKESPLSKKVINLNEQGNDSGAVLNDTFTYNISSYKLNLLYKGNGQTGVTNSYIFKDLGDKIKEDTIKVKILEGNDKYTITDNGTNSLEIAQQFGVQDSGKVKLEITGELKNGKKFKGTFEVTLTEDPKSINFKKQSFDFFVEDLSAPIVIAYDKAKAGKTEGNTIYPFEFLGKYLVDENNAFKSTFTFTVDPADKYKIDGNKIASNTSAYEEENLKIYLNIDGQQGTTPRYFAVNIKKKPVAPDFSKYKLKDYTLPTEYTIGTTQIVPSNDDGSGSTGHYYDYLAGGFWQWQNIPADANGISVKAEGNDIKLKLPANLAPNTYKVKVKAIFKYSKDGVTKDIPGESFITFKIKSATDITGPTVKVASMDFDLANKSTKKVTLKDGSKETPIFRIKPYGTPDSDELVIVGNSGDATSNVSYKLVDTTKYVLKQYKDGSSDEWAIFLADANATPAKNDVIKIQVWGTLQGQNDGYAGETATITLKDDSGSTGGGNNGGSTVDFALNDEVYKRVDSVDGSFEIELSDIITKPTDLDGVNVTFEKDPQDLGKDKFEILASTPKLKIVLKGAYKDETGIQRTLNIKASYNGVTEATKIKVDRVIPVALPDFTLKTEVTKTVDNGVAKMADAPAHFVLSNEDGADSVINIFKDANGAGEYATDDSKFEKLVFNIIDPTDTKYKIVKKAGEGFYLQLKDENAQKVLEEDLTIEVSNGTKTKEISIKITPSVAPDPVTFTLKSEIPVTLGTDTLPGTKKVFLTRNQASVRKGFFFAFDNEVSKDDFAKLEFKASGYTVEMQDDFVMLTKTDDTAITSGNVAVKVKTKDTNQVEQTVTLKFETPATGLGALSLIVPKNATAKIQAPVASKDYVSTDKKQVSTKSPVLFTLVSSDSTWYPYKLNVIESLKANFEDVVFSMADDTIYGLKKLEGLGYAIYLKKGQNPPSTKDLTIKAKVSYENADGTEGEQEKEFVLTILNEGKLDNAAVLALAKNGEATDATEDTTEAKKIKAYKLLEDVTYSGADLYPSNKIIQMKDQEDGLVETEGNPSSGVEYKVVGGSAQSYVKDVVAESNLGNGYTAGVFIRLKDDAEIPADDYTLEVEADVKGIKSNKSTLNFTINTQPAPDVEINQTPNLLKRNTRKMGEYSPLFILKAGTADTNKGEIQIVTNLNGANPEDIEFSGTDASGNYVVKKFEYKENSWSPEISAYGIFTAGDDKVQDITKITDASIVITTSVKGKPNLAPANTTTLTITEPTGLATAEIADPASVNIAKGKIGTGSYDYAKIYPSSGTTDATASYPLVYTLKSDMDYSKAIAMTVTAVDKDGRDKSSSYTLKLEGDDYYKLRGSTAKGDVITITLKQAVSASNSANIGTYTINITD